MPNKAATKPSKPVTQTQIRPDRGRLTFDSEGNEGGRYHSRTLHVPGLSSGLTIGRGYDMGAKSPGQITSDLVAAGVDLASAKTVSGAATLRGEKSNQLGRSATEQARSMAHATGKS
jgi:hypothetical protein